jgi:hypothetical protein
VGSGAGPHTRRRTPIGPLGVPMPDRVETGRRRPARRAHDTLCRPRRSVVAVRRPDPVRVRIDPLSIALGAGAPSRR